MMDYISTVTITNANSEVLDVWNEVIHRMNYEIKNGAIEGSYDLFLKIFYGFNSNEDNKNDYIKQIGCSDLIMQVPSKAKGKLIKFKVTTEGFLLDEFCFYLWKKLVPFCPNLVVTHDWRTTFKPISYGINSYRSDLSTKNGYKKNLKTTLIKKFKGVY